VEKENLVLGRLEKEKGLEVGEAASIEVDVVDEAQRHEQEHPQRRSHEGYGDARPAGPQTAGHEIPKGARPAEGRVAANRTSSAHAVEVGAADNRNRLRGVIL
jgi:hypothetical protein